MGITWYDEGFIRYSNEYIFSTVAEKPFAYQMIIPRTTFRLHNASQSRLVAAISVTAANAAFSPSGYKINFATGEFEAGPSEKLHNILQCTPDILSSDCYKCLLKGIGELPNLKIVKQGGIFLSSCIIRFNLIPVNPSPQGKHICTWKKFIPLIIQKCLSTVNLCCFYLSMQILELQHNHLHFLYRRTTRQDGLMVSVWIWCSILSSCLTESK